jgi:hypothetical protein
MGLNSFTWPAFGIPAFRIGMGFMGAVSVEGVVFFNEPYPALEKTGDPAIPRVAFLQDVLGDRVAWLKTQLASRK